MKGLLTAAVLAIGVAAPGCVVYDDAYDDDHVEVAVPLFHVHSAYCGHYYYDGHCYYNHGHVHGPGCGHMYHGGIWVIAH